MRKKQLDRNIVSFKIFSMNENKQKPVLEGVVERLPEDIREYLVSGSFQNDIKTISEKSALNNEQEALLENEVLYILLGVGEMGELSSNISPQITDNEIRRAVANDAVALLEPFLESILKMEAEVVKEDNESSLKKSVPTPPPKPAPLVYNNASNEAGGSIDLKQGSIEKEKANILKAIEGSDSSYSKEEASSNNGA